MKKLTELALPAISVELDGLSAWMGRPSIPLKVQLHIAFYPCRNEGFPLPQFQQSECYQSFNQFRRLYPQSLGQLRRGPFDRCRFDDQRSRGLFGKLSGRRGGRDRRRRDRPQRLLGNTRLRLVVRHQWLVQGSDLPGDFGQPLDAGEFDHHQR